MSAIIEDPNVLVFKETLTETEVSKASSEGHRLWLRTGWYSTKDVVIKD